MDGVRHQHRLPFRSLRIGKGVRVALPISLELALPAYVAVAIGVAATVLFIAFGGFRFTAPLLVFPPLWGVLLLASGPLARRIGHERLGAGCEAVALIYCQGIAICAALPMLTAYSAPFADDWLIKLDQLFGFDWLAFAMALRDHAGVLAILRASYTSFIWQPALVLVVLFGFRKDQRAWRLVNAAAVALLLTVAVYPFAPAVGPYVHWGISPEMYPNLEIKGPWIFGPAIEHMKSGEKVITPELMIGYVSLPSYHSAAGLLFAWGIWPFKWLRWPLIILNAAMCVAAIVVGAHYLIDILGGFVVAIVGLLVSGLWPSRLDTRAAKPHSNAEVRQPDI